MFESARLRLTLWYLLIIMTISIAFSAVIYQRISSGIGRISNFRRGESSILPNPITDNDPELILLSGVQQQTLLNLVIINIVILVGSGVAGYFLAGLTLEPIEEALEAQQRFTSDASHELRTPLTALQTEVEVALKDKSLPKEAREVLVSNLEEIGKLRLLADNLLSISRRRELSKADFQRVSIKAIYAAAAQKVSSLAKDKKITLVVTTNDDQFVMGDHTRLVELLVILLDNAIKYSHDKGKIDVDWQRDDDKVIIAVKDSGIGISDGDQERIFDRFYRADNARSRNGSGGFGLGLAIAKQIVREHKGEIQVKSAPDKGTTFFVKLPRFRV